MAEADIDSTLSLFEKMQRLSPDNVTFSAILEIKDPINMRRFMDEYAQNFAAESDNEAESSEPMKAAIESMGSELGHFDETTRKRWFSAIEGLEHPEVSSGAAKA